MKRSSRKYLYLILLAIFLLIAGFFVWEMFLKKTDKVDKFYYAHQGWLYSTGKQNTEINYEKAIAYFKEAIKHDDPQGLVYLGIMYMEGKGVKKDYLKAKQLFDEAAEKDFPGAFLYLGWMYHKGLGVEQDFSKAESYYENAYENGIAKAAVNLACMYRDGQGRKKDYNKAEYYFQKAIDLGDKKEALFLLLALYVSEGKYDKAEKLAVKLSDKKDKAFFLLANVCMYQTKNKIENTKRALEYFKDSAQKGNPEAMLRIASIYNHAYNGIKYDPKEAFKWYKKSAEAGNLEAMRVLAFFYSRGFGGNKDISKSYYWYNKAIEKGYTPALEGLIDLLIRENTPEKDIVPLINKYARTAPDNAYTLSNIAGFWIKLGKYDKALDFINTTLKMKPNEPLFKTRLAYCYYRTGKVKESIALLRSVLNEHKNYAHAKHLLAFILVEKDIDLQEPEILLKSLLKNQPLNYYFLDTLGWLYYKQGKYKIAVEKLKEADHLASDIPEIKNHLAMAYLKVGEKEKAIQVWKEALNICKHKDIKDQIEKDINEAGLSEFFPIDDVEVQRVLGDEKE